MRLHNLTDVSTPTLASLSLVNVSITVGGKTIAPGGSEQFKYLPSDAARFLRSGALHNGEKPPAKYLASKAPPEPVKVEDKAEEYVPAMPPPPVEAPAPESEPAPFFTPPSRSKRSRSDE